MPKKKPTCEKISENGEVKRYICETEPGKTFIVTVEPDGTVIPKPSFVAPTPRDYALIHKALIEKGERIRTPPSKPAV